MIELALGFFVLVSLVLSLMAWFGMRNMRDMEEKLEAVTSNLEDLQAIQYSLAYRMADLEEEQRELFSGYIDSEKLIYLQ